MGCAVPAAALAEADESHVLLQPGLLSRRHVSARLAHPAHQRVHHRAHRCVPRNYYYYYYYYSALCDILNPQTLTEHPNDKAISQVFGDQGRGGEFEHDLGHLKVGGNLRWHDRASVARSDCIRGTVAKIWNAGADSRKFCPCCVLRQSPEEEKGVGWRH